MEIPAPELWELVLPKLQALYRQGLSAEFIANFCTATKDGVLQPTHPDTVIGWVRNERPANGERLLKLWHLVSVASGDMRVINDMPPLNRYLSKLFAYGIIDLGVAGVAMQVQNPQSTLKILRGQPPMRPMISLSELEREYSHALSQAEAALRQQLQGLTPTAPSHQPPPRPEPIPPTVAPTAPVMQSSGDVVLDLARLLGSALPLALYLNSDRCSPQDRSRLRGLMGEQGMFDLSNVLNSLCSERARTQER